MYTIGDFSEGSCIEITLSKSKRKLYAVVLEKYDGSDVTPLSMDVVYVQQLRNGYKCHDDEDAVGLECDRVRNDGCFVLFPDMEQHKFDGDSVVLDLDGSVKSFGVASKNMIQNFTDQGLIDSGLVVNPIFVDAQVMRDVAFRFSPDSFDVSYDDVSGKVPAVVPKELLDLYRDHPPTKDVR